MSAFDSEGEIMRGTDHVLVGHWIQESGMPAQEDVLSDRLSSIWKWKEEYAVEAWKKLMGFSVAIAPRARCWLVKSARCKSSGQSTTTDES